MMDGLRRLVPTRGLVVALVVAFIGLLLIGGRDLANPTGAIGASDSVRILAGSPSTLDPAREGDAASAAVTAQLYETLTAFDPELVLRPALASSWAILDEGRTTRFRLRDGLVFSDGSPLTANDVVRSWLRLIDPRSPSPLVALALGIEGAADFLAGRTSDPGGVGLRADGNVVEVRLVRPTDFASIVACPSFGIVPPGIDEMLDPSRFVGSGAYTVDDVAADTLTLVANERYWAGTPSMRKVVLVTDLKGESPVEAFEQKRLDVASISAYDASWIAWNRELGPSLVETPSLSLDYYGFDTSRPPFDDVRVRRAFALAVDWRRIVSLSAGAGVAVADSMVPRGMPGRGSRDFGPAYDPAKAKGLLAEAGYPGGSGFPRIALVSGGFGYDAAVAQELRDVLGIDLDVERMDFDAFFPRLEDDPPPFWALSWIADYPSPNDFLGVLLGSGAASNYPRWASDEFDAAIADAVSAPDPAAARAAYDRAEAIVQRDVPTIPVSYSTGWSLVREGLRGAADNGLGIIRFAGLDWGAP